MRTTDQPSTDLLEFFDQVEGRLDKLTGLLKARKDPDNDGSGIRSAILYQIIDLADFIYRPAKETDK